MNFINIIKQFFLILGNYLLKSGNTYINDISLNYKYQSDDEIKVNCKVAFQKENIEKKTSFKSWIKDAVSKVFLKKTLDDELLDNLGLGIEAFNRRPADLDNNSTLFETQKSVAVAILQGCIIQMDTGEGKTYAILPAAFALACKSKRVYIVCANEYLAYRDAKRTKNYWDFVGLSMSFATSGNEKYWDRNMIYTTLDNILFKHMKDEKSDFEPKNKIEFSNLIIDEVDAVLLDQAWQNYTLTYPIKSDIYDWKPIINIAKQLKKDIHFFKDNKKIFLNSAGEDLIKTELNKLNISFDFYKLNILKKSIENAYVAIYIVKEKTDYTIENNRIHPYDEVTGKPLYNQKRDWIFPLEFLLSLPQRPETIPLHEIPANIFIRKFKHISGLSGTVEYDSVEYLFSYFVPVVIIPPRKLRFNGHAQTDIVYNTKNEVYNNIVSEIIDISPNRPVLVGTQTPDEVEIIYRLLSSNEKLLNSSTIHKIIGENHIENSHIFANAGQQGSIVIATQIAGRGVDIRLSQKVIENGGLYLIGLGRSTEVRYDRQFLGRAGRQGEPFSSVFFVSLKDNLLLFRTFS